MFNKLLKHGVQGSLHHFFHPLLQFYTSFHSFIVSCSFFDRAPLKKMFFDFNLASMKAGRCFAFYVPVSHLLFPHSCVCTSQSFESCLNKGNSRNCSQTFTSTQP